MKYLPIGLNVRDRKCVVVGGGKIGTRKVENLLEAGADVHLVSPDGSPRIEALAATGAITWTRDRFQKDHLDGALLAIAATDDEGVNARLVEVGRELGIMICDASSSERSEFIFGALHSGRGITIAVFSDGEDPTRSRTTRDRIAGLLTDEEGPGTR